MLIKAYNWVTASLLNWLTYNGEATSGILYKPENFDSTKKYPVIFLIYERVSNGLNKFILPELCTGSINIPYFASRGYLVFCPDIHYKLGETGNSIYNYVVSGAEMLSKLRWVAGTKMGIQGHSFGGYEVNYLITKTSIFKSSVFCCWSIRSYKYERNLSRSRSRGKT